MAKRKTDDELLRELGLFNHLEAQRRFLQLMEENKRLREENDRIVSVAVSASNDAERALREEGLL